MEKGGKQTTLTVVWNLRNKEESRRSLMHDLSGVKVVVAGLVLSLILGSIAAGIHGEYRKNHPLPPTPPNYVYLLSNDGKTLVQSYTIEGGTWVSPFGFFKPIGHETMQWKGRMLVSAGKPADLSSLTK